MEPEFENVLILHGPAASITRAIKAFSSADSIFDIKLTRTDSYAKAVVKHNNPWGKTSVFGIPKDKSNVDLKDAQFYKDAAVYNYITTRCLTSTAQSISKRYKSLDVFIYIVLVDSGSVIMNTTNKQSFAHYKEGVTQNMFYCSSSNDILSPTIGTSDVNKESFKTFKAIASV